MQFANSWMLIIAFGVPQKKMEPVTLLCEVAHFKSSTDIKF